MLSLVQLWAHEEIAIWLERLSLWVAKGEGAYKSKKYALRNRADISNLAEIILISNF